MLKNFFKILILLPFVIIFFFSCKNTINSPESYSYRVPEQTGDGWPTASLSSVGIDESLLTNLIDDINRGIYTEVHAILIIKEGRLVFEEYFPGHLFSSYGPDNHGALVDYDRERLHVAHSVSKSITAALVGIAADKGFIGKVDEKIFSYFPAYADLLNEDKDKITIEHLLTMTSGLDWNEEDIPYDQPDSDLVLLYASTDPVRFVLGKPVITDPGAFLYYNGGTVVVLGELVRLTSGISVDDFSEQYLFGPLGITAYRWQKMYPSEVTACHGGCYLRPRDMAKFGYLFLNNGVWKGNRIISANWVKKSAEEYISVPQAPYADGYGYLWWVYTFKSNNRSFPSYRADGWGGQKIIIFPGLDMVVVFTGSNYVRQPPCEEILVRYILPAIN